MLRSIRLKELGFECAHAAILPWKLSNGNEGQDKDWRRADVTRKKAEQLARAFRRRPMEELSLVTVTRILGRGERQWDCDSILRGNAKQLIDALVSAGWFYDDSPQWISGCLGFQDSTRREIGPATEIGIWIFKGE